MKKFSYFVILQKYSLSSQSDDDQFEAYRSFITANLKSVTAESLRTSSELMQKNGTTLLGGLTQFLATPLKSDKDDIMRLIKDSVENTIHQLDAAPMLSSVEHSVWNVMEPSDVPLHRQSVGLLKRLLKNGKQMLKHAGCTFGKNSGPVAISFFSYEGFSTVQSLNHAVKLFEEQKVLLIVNASVSSTLYSSQQNDVADGYQIVFDMNESNDAVMDLLKTQLSTISERFGIKQFSISKQSLHSGFGSPYQIRFGLDINKQKLGSVLSAITDDHTVLNEALTHDSSLIVLEKSK